MRAGSCIRFLISAISLFGLATFANSPALGAVRDRVQVAIANSRPTEIPDSVHPRAKLANDLGPMKADTLLQGMALHFSLTADQEAALDQLLADQQNPSSPRYHQWLTPAQYGAQFGLSDADVASVKAWLTNQGFKVTGVANGGTFITFDGTVAQAEAAFSTSIHSLSLNGEVHFANVTNASVPSALAKVVSGVTGLHNFRLKPRLHLAPQFTSSISGNHYLAPGDLYTIYDMNPLLSSAINGTGVTIAVMGQVDISTTDVGAFRSASGLSTNSLPTTVHEGGDPGSPTCSNTSCSPNDGDVAESSIDVEWAGAAAPGASILFVNGPDVLFNSVTQAIDQNLAPIITLSYGACESAWGVTDLNSFNQLFKQANAQGQTILAASGDVGATDCDAGTSASEGLAVDFPASSPYVTGLGGTMFNDGTATGATNYWSAGNGTTSGSALSYIPETVWNEDSAGSSFSAGGGGVSAFFTRPAWQVETGPPGMTTTVPADGSRDVPDLALDAASAHDQFLYCAQGSCVSGFRQANNNLTAAGGTSFDSQIFGGILALIEQKTGGRIGNANPTIYALGNKTAFYNNTSTSVFHDVTSGNNSSPCSAGTPNCASGGTIGFNAGVGYDLASGWGTVDVNNLASDWNLVTPLGVGTLGPNVSATALTSSSITAVAGASVTLTATVTGGSGTPTGTVQFTVNNVAAAGSSLVTLNGSGVATYTLVTSCATLGQLQVAAVYSGDAVYQGSKGPALLAGSAGNTGGTTITSNGSTVTTPLIVTVSSGSCPDFSMTAAQSSVTVPAGGTPVATVTVAPINNFTGTVVFSATATETTSYAPGFTFNPASVNITGAGSASTTVTLTGLVADLRLPAVREDTRSGTMLARQENGRRPLYAAGSGITLASLLLLMVPRKRRLAGLLLVVLAVALVGGVTGCGSSSQAAPPPVNPYIGTYTVTVIGTYTSSTSQVTQHSAVVTFQVN